MWWEIKYWHPDDPNNTKTEIIDESNLGKFIESRVKDGFAFSMRFIKRTIHPSPPPSQLKSITIQTTTQEKANRENKKIKGKLRKNKKLKYINRNNICYRR